MNKLYGLCSVRYKTLKLWKEMFGNRLEENDLEVIRCRNEMELLRHLMWIFSDSHIDYEGDIDGWLERND